jgi:hypothetical protein
MYAALLSCTDAATIAVKLTMPVRDYLRPPRVPNSPHVLEDKTNGANQVIKGVKGSWQSYAMPIFHRGTEQRFQDKPCTPMPSLGECQVVLQNLQGLRTITVFSEKKFLSFTGQQMRSRILACVLTD